MRRLGVPGVLALTPRTISLAFSEVRSPGTTARTSLLSASMAVWSQRSPLSSSRGSSGSVFFSFLSTKDHFSSSWTSRVRGGKSHEFVVEGLGVLACEPGVSGHGVGPDVDQAARGAGAAALAEVFEDGDRLLLGQARTLERGGLALGVSLLAGAAIHHAD